jgi:hypothetical protein
VSLLSKKEYPPLFEAGIHDIDIESLEDVFLEPFTEQSHRQKLINGLKKFLSLLQSFDMPLEVWLDGSFSTEKPNPNDVDICVFGSNSDITKLGSDGSALFQSLFDCPQETKIRYCCDVYFADPDYDEERMSYLGLFGFSRNENPKGIPRVRISP